MKANINGINMIIEQSDDIYEVEIDNMKTKINAPMEGIDFLNELIKIQKLSSGELILKLEPLRLQLQTILQSNNLDENELQYVASSLGWVNCLIQYNITPTQEDMDELEEEILNY